jgi:diguanylate cyclase (GGDEF)-like protein
MWSDLHDKGYWAGEIWNRRKYGEVYPAMMTIVAVRNGRGKTRQYVAMFSDISERKAMEEQVRQLAFYDPLTNLPNRRLLDDRLGQALTASQRTARYGAIMVLDLDNFKAINDSHGHLVGDLLLVEAAQRLTACVRGIDTVARFGGDEFVVLLGDLDADREISSALAARVAEKIRASLSEPFVLAIGQPGNTEVTIEHSCSASIGVVVFLDNVASQTDILKWADAAMYQGKGAGRNCVRFYQTP